MSDLSEIYELLAKDQSKSLVHTIEERLDALDVSQRQVSEAIGVQRRTLQRILEGEAQKIDLLTVLKISQFLDIDIKEISQLYVAGLSSTNIGELERARKAGFIMRHFDLDVLKRIEFISDVTDFEHIEKRIKDFFQLSSIDEYANEVAYSLFSKTRNKSCDKMTKFWIGSAYKQCAEIGNPNPFDRQMLLQIIPRLRVLTRDEEHGLVQAVRALYQAGVTVVVQGYVSKIQIRGATFLVNSKPCIVISDYNKRLDTIWFTLMHELYHVMKDLDAIQKLGFHTTKEEGQRVIDFVNEDLANSFASEFLVPSDKVKFIRAFLDVASLVDSYASKWGIHSAILYGMHLSKHGEDYLKFRKRIPAPDALLRAFFAYPWNQESLTETAQNLKETIYLNH